MAYTAPNHKVIQFLIAVTRNFEDEFIFKTHLSFVFHVSIYCLLISFLQKKNSWTHGGFISGQMHSGVINKDIRFNRKISVVVFNIPQVGSNILYSKEAKQVVLVEKAWIPLCFTWHSLTHSSWVPMKIYHISSRSFTIQVASIDPLPCPGTWHSAVHGIYRSPIVLFNTIGSIVLPDYLWVCSPKEVRYACVKMYLLLAVFRRVTSRVVAWVGDRCHGLDSRIRSMLF